MRKNVPLQMLTYEMLLEEKNSPNAMEIEVPSQTPQVPSQTPQVPDEEYDPDIHLNQIVEKIQSPVAQPPVIPIPVAPIPTLTKEGMEEEEMNELNKFNRALDKMTKAGAGALSRPGRGRPGLWRYYRDMAVVRGVSRVL